MKSRLSLQKTLLRMVYIAGILITGSLQGQVITPDQMENAMERMTETSGDESDHPEWTEQMSRLRDRPLNLNAATLEDLLEVPFLTDRQAEAILNYRLNYGDFLSVYELCSIGGFDSVAVRLLQPYLTAGPGADPHPLKLKNILREGHLQLLAGYRQILQKQAGYGVPDSVLVREPDAGYPGGPQKYSFRLEYLYADRLAIGFCGEKDPGEQFFRGAQPYGMDYYSGYLRLRNTGFLRELILGNFRADFGQGLVMGSGAMYGASAASPDLMRFAAGVRPCLTANETSYLRGMATRMRFGPFDLSLFCSGHRRDARLSAVDTSGPGDPAVTTILNTGYHRLPSEIATKNALREFIAGGNIQYRNRFLSAGLTGFYTRWSATFMPDPEPYKRYALTGRENLNLGADFRLHAGNFYLFGEAGRSRNGGWAWLAGIQYHPDPCSAVSLLYRDYHSDYQDLLSCAAGRNTPSGNERGFLVKASVQAAKNLTIRGYADLFSFPWLKYRTGFPSKGSEWMAEGDLTAGRTLTLYGQFRSTAKQMDVTGSETAVKRWINLKSWSIRFQVNWQVSPALLLRSRFEFLEDHYEMQPVRHGCLLFQDFIYKPLRFPVSLVFRYALFSTDSWDERMYAYEPEVLYGYSVPALDGEGIRCLLMVHVKIIRNLEATIRFAETRYTDRSVIGTGPDLIHGNSKSELEIQLKIRV
ncbi:MAG TPA: helix-hairpin-helix domain-containing protein [Bacteroidales bacterium]|nr:helix-hairpin-helix domain-containing protein [Bacteroidales bacterium]